MNKKLIWLDDFRDPLKDDWLVFSPIGRSGVEVFWIKNYIDFTEWITNNDLPDAICFDHDLSDFQAFYFSYPELMSEVPYPEYEKTGKDCVKWLVDYCLDNNLQVPEYNCQTSNQVGKENMTGLLENYKKHFKKENMALFGGSWNEDSERDEIGPLSHWDEDLENLEEVGPIGGLHNTQGDDFDYEGIKYFKDGE